MATSNLLSLNIPDQDLNEIEGAINTLESRLMPHLKNLSPEERRNILKLGDKSVAFVERARDWVKEYPQLKPPYGDLEELDKDLKAMKLVNRLLRSIEPIFNGLEDTLLLAGSEAYAEGLAYYSYFKAAAKAKVDNAEEAYHDLKRWFPGGSSKVSKNEKESLA
ncbi:MAG: hypothetical protein K9H65_02260 [Bacteroidales bacterium]|nr:hypothetical protein [Bacteroidales bacterium]